MIPQRDCPDNFPKPLKRNLLIAVVVTAVLFIITGCETPPLPELDSPEAKLYIEKCSLCHPVQHPKIINYRSWVRKVDQMEKKVKISGKREPLTDEERSIILGYLKKHARMQ